MDGIFKKPLVKTVNDDYKQTENDGTIRTETATVVPSSPSSVSDSSDDGTMTRMMNDSRIPWKTANMLWFSGLRGAVSYALVKTFPKTGNENTFVVTTMLIVLVTTFVFGGGTETALKALNIQVNVDEQEYLKSVERKKLLGDGWLGRFEAYRVRAWVLRDFAKVQKQEEQPLSANSSSGASRRQEESASHKEFQDQETGGETRQANDDGSYHEPVEMTEHDHMSVAAAITSKKTRKTQLYDFGQ
jgi:hypothetical protein